MSLVLKDTWAFYDTFSFMSSSLDSLVNDLRKSNHDFSSLKNCTELWQFKQTKPSAQQKARGLELILQKGVYPYEWARSVEDLQSCDSLPSEKDFYSTLKGQSISQKDHERAWKVLNVFECMSNFQ